MAIFAGWCPESELEKLDWDDVDFGETQTLVAANFDKKTGQKRLLPMEENLLEWLAPWRGAGGS